MKKILIFLLTLGMIFQFSVGYAVAQEDSGLSEPQMPGRIEGTGTHFELQNSEYLNITLDSSEAIKLVLESIPEMVTMYLESASGASLTTITLGGFMPSTTYHKYEDDYHNHTAFTTDSEGRYTFTQDISQPHLVFIQPRESTKYIKDDATGGDCTAIGTWDPTTKTCTLTMDLTETIQIDSNGITLDGNGRSITGAGTGSGVYLSGRTGVTIKNLNIRRFWSGIDLYSSNGNTLTDNTVSNNRVGIGLGFYSKSNIITSNTVSNNFAGIEVYYGSYQNILANNIAISNRYGIEISLSVSNTLTDNTVSNNDFGIMLIRGSSNNTLTGNTVSSNYYYGIYIVWNSNNNTLTGNTVSSNYYYGIYIEWDCKNNKIYNNNINNNLIQAYVQDGSGNNVFNLAAPIGGNYWSNYDTPAEGCYNTNGDNFCDAPYVFPGGQDNLPWIQQNGWLDSIPPFTTDNSPSTWQKADFTVLLTCTDNPGGSGCKETKYRVDSGAWQTGNLISISIEGDHLIEYYSIDNMGNQESIKSTHVKLDKTLPSINIISPQAQDYFSTQTITIDFNATDTLSGIANISSTLDGNPVANGQIINLKNLALGSHTLEVSAQDNAGNNAIQSVTFNVVPVPFSSFSAKVEAEIGTSTVENKLEAKGNFTLGQESDGINPVNEAVKIKIGNFETTIPAGSFKWFEHPKKPEKSEWKFKGTIDGVPIEMKIKPLGNNNFEFKFEAENLNLCWIESPLEVRLNLGDDFGKIEVTPEIEELENWGNVCTDMSLPPEFQTPGISPD